MKKSATFILFLLAIAAAILVSGCSKQGYSDQQPSQPSEQQEQPSPAATPSTSPAAQPPVPLSAPQEPPQPQVGGNLQTTDSVCKNDDSYCPWECNDWQLDNDCGTPEIYDFVESRNPNDYLNSDMIHWDDTDWKSYGPLIQKVNQLTTSLTDDFEKAKAIANWVKHSRPYSEPSPANKGKGVIDIFNADTGICMDAAILTVAMFRMANIPSRGVLPPWHEYAEAYIDGRWIAFDSTFGDGDVSITDPVTAILSTNQFYKKEPRFLTIFSDGTTKEVSDIAYYKVNLIPTDISRNRDESNPLSWESIYIPTTSKAIFQNKDTTFSLIYDKEKYYDFTNVMWYIKSDNLNCDYYRCTYVESNQYSQVIARPSILGYGTLSESGGRTMPPEHYNGFAKIKLPEGRYKLIYATPFIDEIAYQFFEVQSNKKAILWPDELRKGNTATQNQFEVFQTALGKSINGLSP